MRWVAAPVNDPFFVTEEFALISSLGMAATFKAINGSGLRAVSMQRAPPTLYQIQTGR